MMGHGKMTEPTPGTFRLLDHLGNIIATGASSREAMAPLPDSAARKTMLAEWAKYKADAAEARLQQRRAHASSIRTLTDGITRLTHRIDALELRHADARRRRAKERCEAEAKAILDYLDALPDPDNPCSHGEGELTSHGPSGPEDEQQLRAMTSGDDEDNVGDLPPKLTKGAPPPPANYPTLGQPPRPQTSQPVSISLNEA
jgi:hypothetical protein